jgi:hypothetical protein
MPNTITYLGKKYGVADQELLFRTMEGRVLSAYQESYKLTGLIQEESVTESNKGVDFPYLTDVTASYYTRDSAIESTGEPEEDVRTILIDRPIKGKTKVDLQDAAFRSYSVKDWHLKKIGDALARKKEIQALQAGVLAARTAAKGTAGNSNYIPGGLKIEAANVHTNADTFYAALLQAGAEMDTKNVPEDDRYVFVDPFLYNLLFSKTDLFSTQLGGEGSIANRQFLTAAGMTIVKTNRLPKTNIASAEAGARNTYHGDFSKTKALVLHKEALGIATQWQVQFKTIEGTAEGNELDLFLFGYHAYGIGTVNPQGAVEIAIP